MNSLGAGPRPLRVLLVAEALASGVLAVLREVVEECHERGHQVVLAHGRRPETPVDVAATFDGKLAGIAPVWRGREVAEQPRAVRRLRRAVDSWRPDVIHAHSTYAGAAVATLGRRSPSIYTPHGYAFLRRDVSRLNRGAVLGAEVLMARRVGWVGACSEAEAHLARTVVRAPRVVSVQNGIATLDDMTAYRDEPPAPRGYVATAGRIGAQRQPAETARILNAVRDLASPCWIGGAPDDQSADLATVNRLDIEVTGWLEPDAVAATLRRTAVFLHWTAWDGLPIAVLEAVAAGCVVVASDIAPNREILGDSFVRKSPAEAVRLIRELLTDRRRFIEAARDQRGRAARFGARRMRTEWTDLYEKLPSMPLQGASGR